MQNTPDLDTVEAEARQLLDARMGAVRNLAQTRQIVAQREAELREAHDADRAAYDAATGSGWTDDELRRVGLGRLDSDKPGRTTRPARRRTARTRATTSPTPATTTPEPSEPSDPTNPVDQPGGDDDA